MFHDMEQTTTERTAAVVRAEVARRRVRTSELSALLGVSRTTIWRRLNGTQPFDVDELTRVANYLDVPVAAFFADQTAA